MVNKADVRALGWFLRIVPAASEATAFYEHRFGLPLVRRIGTNQLDVYWAGEVIMFELVFSKHIVPVSPDDPVASACIPVFRVQALTPLLARLEHHPTKRDHPSDKDAPTYRKARAQADPLRSDWALEAAGIACASPAQRGGARETFFRDNEGFRIGLRECGTDAVSPHDVEARRRAVRGEAYNPGCKSLPEGLRELGWIIRHVADLEAQVRFYAEIVGLAELGRVQGRVQFDLGDNAILELAPGGARQPTPADRHHAYSFFVLRVGDIAAFRDRMRAAGTTVVNERLVYYWAEISYFADPEGHVFGVEQGFHPGTYAPEKPVWPEALEAERRWVERVGASS